ncbi:MAG: hypothetical protein WCG29_14500, partial [Desulfomonile sp.]
KRLLRSISSSMKPESHFGNSSHPVQNSQSFTTVQGMNTLGSGDPIGWHSRNFLFIKFGSAQLQHFVDRYGVHKGLCVKANLSQVWQRGSSTRLFMVRITESRTGDKVMPLLFRSRSHGMVAFGFFNIETDMLLLENLFFFADRFCQAVVSLAEQSAVSEKDVWMDGFRIQDPTLIGNLHGAIQGVDLRGFIGETYRQFPFPASQWAFKQKPDGVKNQSLVQGLIRKFAEDKPIRLSLDIQSSTTSIDEFVFEQKEFEELTAYVDRGGYPRWQDEIRPPYVQAMMKKLAQ